MGSWLCKRLAVTDNNIHTGASGKMLANRLSLETWECPSCYKSNNHLVHKVSGKCDVCNSEYDLV